MWLATHGAGVPGDARDLDKSMRYEYAYDARTCSLSCSLHVSFFVLPSIRTPRLLVMWSLGRTCGLCVGVLVPCVRLDVDVCMIVLRRLPVYGARGNV